MKETYLSRDFRETAALCFPSQAKELNAFFDARLNVLLAENADASKEKQYHLRRQILPGIAAYETLQRVMPKEEALQIVHGYVERLARTSHKQLATLLLIPGLYRLVPSVLSNPRGASSARRRALTQRSCRSATVYGVWIGKITAGMPGMDGDMWTLAQQTLSKLKRMTNSDYDSQKFYFTDENE